MTEQSVPLQDLNRVIFNRAFQEVWYFKLNDPAHQRALWIRFSLLTSSNGFKKVAETWVAYFQKNKQKEVKKIVLKNSQDIRNFVRKGPQGAKMGDCELLEKSSQGLIQSKGSSVEWNLTFTPILASSFSKTPKLLSQFGLMKNSSETIHEDLIFSGTTKINGEEIQWNQAPGMLAHQVGPRTDHSWTWGQCNTFLNENQNPVEFLFEGITTKAHLGPVLSPPLSTFYFYYQGQNYYFNRVKDLFHLRSKSTLNEWKFQADRGDLSFRGDLRADYKDFAGMTYEDTNGSLLFSAHSELSTMRILVYRRGKLEATFTADGTAGLEIVSRLKNPYVPLLV